MAACDSAPASVQPNGGVTAAPVSPKNKTVTGVWAQEPDNITPYYTQMPQAIWIAQLTLVGLAEWDDKGNLIPELAETLPTVENGGISKDGLTITWKLKKGLKWSDGQPITSKDVKFTWDSLKDPKNKPVNFEGYEVIEKIDTPDDLTVAIKFKGVYANWQTLFTQGAHNAGAILPEHIFKGKSALESNAEIRQPKVVSGPFMISEWKAGASLTLLPNANFYKGKPRLEKIQIRFVPTPEAGMSLLASGEADWYPDFTETDLAALKKLGSKVLVKVMPTPEFEHLFFNLSSTKGVDGKGKSDIEGACALQDVRVRKAVILGINRQAIANLFYDGKGIVPVTQWANTPWVNTDLKAEGYDVEGAKKLLDEAGYKAGGDGIRAGSCNGKESKLVFNFETINTPARRQVMTAVQSDLKKIGVDLKINFVTYGDFFGSYDDGSNIATGKFDMGGITNGFHPDPYTDGWLCNAVSSKANPIGANYYHYCNADLDKLFAEAQSTADPIVRKKALEAIQKHIYDNALVVMLYTHASVQAHLERFLPAPYSFLSGMNWNAELWDVKN